MHATSRYARYRPVTALLLSFALMGAAGCELALAQHGEKVTAEWRKSYQLQPGGRFEISNINGKIDVRPSEGNAVEIVAIKSARGTNQDAARQGLERIEIRETASASEIKIQTHVERSGGFFTNQGSTGVEYTVRVPANAELKVTTVNGGVEVTGITGRVTAEATNGGVRGRDIAGEIDASTTNGGVDVEMSTIPAGGVKLECTNGGIRLRLPSDAKATVSARVTNGGIDTDDLPLTIRGEASKRRLDGDLNGGGPRISLSGTNGGIRISRKQ